MDVKTWDAILDKIEKKFNNWTYPFHLTDIELDAIATLIEGIPVMCKRCDVERQTDERETWCRPDVPHDYELRPELGWWER